MAVVICRRVAVGRKSFVVIERMSAVELSFPGIASTIMLLLECFELWNTIANFTLDV